MKNIVSLVIYGIPIAQGSKRAFYKQGMKRAVLAEDSSKVKPWRQEIAIGALEQMKRLKIAPALAGTPVVVQCMFYFPRPKSLKKAITAKTTKPDVDKLARAVLDALTGTMFADDGQVVELRVAKLFGDVPRAEITAYFVIDAPLFAR
jgi:crossover junction endodeoxyribonuclease RusA